MGFSLFFTLSYTKECQYSLMLSRMCVGRAVIFLIFYEEV